MVDYSPLLRRYGVFLAVVLLILFNLAVTPHFATMQTLSVNLTQVCTIVIVGVGMTLVIATGGIDLSVGALMAIAGAMSPMFFTGESVSRSQYLCGDCFGNCVSHHYRQLFWPLQRLADQPVLHPAHYRHAGSFHRRTRHCTGFDQW